MEIFWTIFIGITVFVFSQIFLRLVIEPIYQLKKTMANVSNIFVYHAVALHNSDLFTKDLKGKELFDRLEVKKLLAIQSWISLKGHINTYEEILKNMKKTCENLGLYIDPKNIIQDTEDK